MIDIVSAAPGQDLGIQNTETPRAANILGTQLGSLEYLPDLGIDLDYFLTDPTRIQNESFRAYLIETLANQGINVVEVSTILNSLYADYFITIGASESSTGFMAR